MEDYLEMMYRIVKEKGYVRAVDLSEALQFQSSSVTKMIQKLDEAGFINYEKYRNISLTPQGEKYGKFLVWRDHTLKEFLRLLNANAPAHIEEQVEGMEHYITPVTMQLIDNLIKFFHNDPQGLKELHELQAENITSRDEFSLLRAWEFRHNTDES